jgi:phenylacetate-coenzyme A ligase PaaK-like adenylate-forming protein
VLIFPGVRLHPHVIRSVLVHLPQVADYQVRQTQAGIDVDVLPAGPPDRPDVASAAEIADRLRDALAAAGLADPLVHVRVVSDLERHRDSGKLSRFVPLAAS